MNYPNDIYKYTSDLDVLCYSNKLICEDSHEVLISKLFHSIDFVHNEQDGLELFKNYYKKNNFYYDFVLFDIPQIDTYKLFDELYALNNQQVFIVITEASEVDKITNLINIGAVYLIIKPFETDVLYNILYKVSKSIINDRLAIEHLQVAEAFNEHLKSYNDTLSEKLAEQAKVLEQNQATIINQSKFAIMGEMIAMIAHQWKQPLNVISLNIANLEMMQMTGKYSKKELNEIIENSNETIEYMSKTIHDFTEFLRPSDIKETVKIGAIFYQLISLIKADITEYNIDFSIDYKIDKDLTIELNSSKFTQVVINIIKNSIDEFKEKHTINPKIKIIIDMSDNAYIITIKDNAGGIPNELINTIFEPYVSTKGKNGTGLGMYMSKLLVVSHLGGTIDVANHDDGALFTIKLSVIERRKRERIYV